MADKHPAEFSKTAVLAINQSVCDVWIDHTSC